MGWVFESYGTNLKTVFPSGLTTFMTMACIIFVNSAMGKEVITALSAGIATLMMGFYAKKPFALVPGMGLNA